MKCPQCSEPLVFTEDTLACAECGYSQPVERDAQPHRFDEPTALLSVGAMP